MRQSMAVDAVIVTHNSGGELGTLLDSDLTREAFNRIIVVDNASSDDTVAIARDAGVEVCARDTNDGFGVAVNVGARLVSSDRFAVLNPDIELTSTDTLDIVLRHFEESRVGIVAPALRLPDGRLQDSVREIPTVATLVARRVLPGQAQRGAITSDSVRDVPWAVAACWFVDRRWFAKINGFDERYFLYFEDVDFCVRLGKHGGVVRFDPSAVVEHRHRGDSRRSVGGWANRQHMRSAGRFFVTHPEYVYRQNARLRR